MMAVFAVDIFRFAWSFVGELVVNRRYVGASDQEYTVRSHIVL
jgi:hypothetical protein